MYDEEEEPIKKELYSVVTTAKNRAQIEIEWKEKDALPKVSVSSSCWPTESFLTKVPSRIAKELSNNWYGGKILWTLEKFGQDVKITLSGVRIEE